MITEPMPRKAEDFLNYQNSITDDRANQVSGSKTADQQPDAKAGLQHGGTSDHSQPKGSENEENRDGIRVSVIIPVLNAEKTIDACLESITGQTHGNLEILCIDGGSADRSVEIIQKRQAQDSRIILLQKACTSTGQARNIGLAAAHGKYTAFVDSHDTVEKDMIAKLLAEAESRSCDVVCFPCRKYSERELIFFPGNHYLSQDTAALPKPFSRRDMPETLFQTGEKYAFDRFYRTDFLREHQICFQEIPFYDDFSFFISCLTKAEKISCISEPLYIHHILKGSKGSSRWKYTGCLFDAFEYTLETNPELSADSKLFESFCKECCAQIRAIMQTFVQPEARFKAFELLDTERFSWLMDFISVSRDSLPMPHKKMADSIAGAMEAFRSGFFAGSGQVPQCLAEGKISGTPLVSVIMPVYNSEAYLPETLDAVLAQSMRDFELICINDGSTDASCKILMDYARKDGRIRVFTQKNAGVAAARNVGIENAAGKYIQFADSDDLMSENALEVLSRQAEEKDLDVLYLNADCFHDSGCTEKERAYRPSYQRTCSYPEVTSGKELFVRFSENYEFFITLWMAFFKRSLLVENHIRFKQGNAHDDNLFSLTVITKAQRAGYFDRILYSRRIRPESIMTAERKFINSYSYFDSLKDTMELIREESGRSDPAWLHYTEYRAGQLLNLARKDFRALSNFEKGKYYALKDDFILFRYLIVENDNLAGAKEALDQKQVKNAEEIRKLRKQNAVLKQKQTDAEKKAAAAETENNSRLAEKTEQIGLLTAEVEKLKKRSADHADTEKKYQKELSRKENELNAARKELDGIYRSASWKTGNLLIQPLHLIKQLFTKKKRSG